MEIIIRYLKRRLSYLDKIEKVTGEVPEHIQGMRSAYQDILKLIDRIY